MQRLASLLAAAAVSATLAAVPGIPAAADVEVGDPIVLPQTGGGDVVLLPGTRTLVVAGGDDSPVVVVDTVTREVTAVPDSEGVRSLDLDEDGILLHATSRTPAEVVEIDPYAAEVRRRWDVPDACNLNDAVMRGGVIWVAQGCADEHVRRLDPTTGALTTPAPDLEAQSLVGEPNGPGIYTLMNASIATITHQEASDGELTEVATRDHDYFPLSSELLRISEDGGTLFVPGWSPDSRDTVTFDAATLTLGPRWPRTSPALWADETTIGAAAGGTGTPTLLRRDGLTEVNRFLPDDATHMTTFDARIDPGGNLLATVLVEGEKRVYVVDQPLLAEPTMEIEVPWGETGIGTPTPVEGSFTWDGEAPLEPAELVLSEVQPARRVVGTVTTAADGTWQATWTPAATGLHVLEARWSPTGPGARDSVARIRLNVRDEYRRIDLSGPATVDGGESFEVTATATLNGQPLADTLVSLRRQDWAKPSYFDFEQLGSKSTDDTGTATWQVSPEAVDGYWFSASADFPDWGSSQDYNTTIRELGVEVVRAPTTVSIGETPETAVPGEPVDITLSLTTGDGLPVPGEGLDLVLRRPSGARSEATVTTGEDGTATYVDTTTGEGWTLAEVRFPGSLTLDDSQAWRYVAERRKIEEALSVDGPTTGEVGVPVTLTGAVTGAEEPLTLTVYEDDGDRFTVTTAADGTWSTPVTPEQPGANPFTVHFAGDGRIAEHYVVHTVTTPKAQPMVEVDTATGRVGEPLRITGTVSGLVRASVVTVATDGAAAVEQSVDTDGSFDVALPAPTEAGSVDVVVSIPADPRQQAASTTRAVDVEPLPVLTNRLRGGTFTGSTAPYRVYAAGVRPRLASTVRPRELDGCVERVVQRRRSGRWTEVDRRCLPYAGERRISSRLPSGPVRSKFRVRTEWPDDVWSTVTSTWDLYRFRR